MDRLQRLQPQAMMKLDVQYRMHPVVASWPNKYFYGGILQNGPAVMKERSSNLFPYLLFDLPFSKEERFKHSIGNAKEAAFVARLARTARDCCGGGRKVSVISFYAKQCELVRSELKKMKSVSIPVKTVDCFQGSESDVVILSCVRTKPKRIGFTADSERLNVALTRAKFSLFVVGQFDALKVSNFSTSFCFEYLF